jgi:UPF0755 protein
LSCRDDLVKGLIFVSGDLNDSRHGKEKAMMPVKAMRIIVWAGLVVVLCVAGIFFRFYRYAVSPVGPSEVPVVVWIEPGKGFFETMDVLEEAGLVNDRDKFRWLAYLRGDETRIRAGEYALRASMSPMAMLDRLVRGEAILRKVVIPEGITAAKIAEIVEREGLVSRETFLRAVSDQAIVQVLGVEGNTLEGYLFPETYHFSKGVTAEEIIGKMVSQFRAVFTPEWTDRARQMGFSVHQIVTLASIVERETGKPDERPLIASVMLNRLKRHMRLESDPTVIYGLEGFDGNIRREDLNRLTPYNTYRIQGLPAGPIGNPGKASLEAVLYPSDASYLYFVSRNDGSHHFSRTLSEHNRMVRKYQLSRR